MDHGEDAAAALLDAYSQVGRKDAWHPVWDVIAAVDFLPYYEGQQAVEAWSWDEVGGSQARFDAFLTGAVRRSA